MWTRTFTDVLIVSSLVQLAKHGRAAAGAGLHRQPCASGSRLQVVVVEPAAAQAGSSRS